MKNAKTYVHDCLTIGELENFNRDRLSWFLYEFEEFVYFGEDAIDVCMRLLDGIDQTKNNITGANKLIPKALELIDDSVSLIDRVRSIVVSIDDLLAIDDLEKRPVSVFDNLRESTRGIKVSTSPPTTRLLRLFSRPIPTEDGQRVSLESLSDCDDCERVQSVINYAEECFVDGAIFKDIKSLVASIDKEISATARNFSDSGYKVKRLL